jgi:hypothetical protein
MEHKYQTVLNCPSKKRVKNLNINFTCLRELTKPQKDIATDLSKLGFFFIAEIFMAKELSKDTTLKRVKVLAITKQTTEATKKNCISIRAISEIWC